MAAFNETYWTVTSAVAPVIALAAIVSAGDLWRQSDRVPLPSAESALVNLLLTLQGLNIVVQASVLRVSLASIAGQRDMLGPTWLLPSLGRVTSLEFGGIYALIVSTAGLAFVRYRLRKLLPYAPYRVQSVSLDYSSIERLTAAIRSAEPDPPRAPADDAPA